MTLASLVVRRYTPRACRAGWYTVKVTTYTVETIRFTTTVGVWNGHSRRQA